MFSVTLNDANGWVLCHEQHRATVGPKVETHVARAFSFFLQFCLCQRQKHPL